MYNSTNEYEVSILVNGRPIPEINFSGRTYIEGRKGSEYSLCIKNNTNKPILVIPSVDGLNVIDGEECGLESPGYVIDHYHTIIIPGWKVAGAQEAGRFEFLPQGAKYGDEQTYAESLGLNPTNQGSIGFMVFRELVEPTGFFIDSNPCRPPLEPYGPMTVKSSFNDSRGGSFTSTVIGSTEASVTLDSCPVSASNASDEHLGTGWGEAVEFHTHDVEFKRANPSTPDAVFVYYYDTVRNLKRIGVPVEQFYGHSSPPTEANPFPASPHVHGAGCKPPPGWRRKKGRGRR